MEDLALEELAWGEVVATEVLDSVAVSLSLLKAKERRD